MGFRDRKGRGPILSVSTAPATGDETGTTINADATVNHHDFKVYPIKFEFYVNRQLVSTQISSPELPGPASYTVLQKDTPTPFNYAVVATLLYPNRSFSSAVYGAMFSNDFAASLKSCTLTLQNPSTTGSATSQTYSAPTITVTQQGNAAFTVAFTTSTLSDGGSASEVTANASLSVEGEKITGSLLTTRDSVSERFQLSGTATEKESVVDSFTAKTSDGTTALACE